MRWHFFGKRTVPNALFVGAQEHIAPADSFRYAAFDSLRASEKPSEILLDGGERVPPNLRLKQTLCHARPAPKPKTLLSRNSKSAFLYIRSSGLLGLGCNNDSKSDLYVLKCPVCFRTTFTSLQGLLNHARISHSLEWGTHEECIRACVVADPEIDVAAGIEVGAGSGGILPGIRTIFEMAVGPSHSGSRVRSTVEDKTIYKAQSNGPAFSHLTRTLGLHENSPALAPFLGKEPVRRGIKVYQQDEILDIEGLDGNFPRRSICFRDRWRPRFTQRSNAYDDQNPKEAFLSHHVLASDAHISGVEDGSIENLDNRLALGAVTTRFHFTTRVIVTDRSLWIDASTLLFLIFTELDTQRMHSPKVRTARSPTNGC